MSAFLHAWGPGTIHLIAAIGFSFSGAYSVHRAFQAYQRPNGFGGFAIWFVAASFCALFAATELFRS